MDILNNPIKKGVIATFNCPNCAGTIKLKAAGISTTAVCASCGTVIDTTNENYRIIFKSEQNTKNVTIPLGSRGVLFGVDWEVIGYQEKCDETGMYYWEEYLLFNPYHGFRFLVDNNEHWSFVKLIKKDIIGVMGRNDVEFEGRDYKIFLRGGSRVTYVMGEFYWRIKIGDLSNVADYISPPYMLSYEAYNDEITWSLGVYVPHTTIKEAFALNFISSPKGIAPNQPSPYAEKRGGVKLIAAIFFAALVAIQIIGLGSATKEVLYSNQLTIYPQDKGRDFVLSGLNIPNNIGNLGVEIYSPLANNWLEVDMSFVNKNTSKAYDLLESVEYYSGYDSDGSWSEGSYTKDEIMSSIPGGVYDVVLAADSGLFQSGQPVTFNMQVVRNVESWSNFGWTVFLLMVYPLIFLTRSGAFEKKRWYDSDYAPVIYRSNYDGDYESD